MPTARVMRLRQGWLAGGRRGRARPGRPAPGPGCGPGSAGRAGRRAGGRARLSPAQRQAKWPLGGEQRHDGAARQAALGGLAWSSLVAGGRAAACTARRRSAAPSVGGSRARLAVTSRLASSPRSCPPMPSATTHRPRSGRAAALSSLSWRTWPTWLRTAERKAVRRRAPPSRAGRSRRRAWRRTARAGAGRRRPGGWAARPASLGSTRGCRPAPGAPATPSPRARRAAAGQPGRDLGQAGCRQLVQVRFQLLEARPIPQRGQGQFFQAIVPSAAPPGAGRSAVARRRTQRSGRRESSGRPCRRSAARCPRRPGRSSRAASAKRQTGAVEVGGRASPRPAARGSRPGPGPASRPRVGQLGRQPARRRKSPLVGSLPKMPRRRIATGHPGSGTAGTARG